MATYKQTIQNKQLAKEKFVENFLTEFDIWFDANKDKKQKPISLEELEKTMASYFEKE